MKIILGLLSINSAQFVNMNKKLVCKIIKKSTMIMVATKPRIKRVNYTHTELKEISSMNSATILNFDILNNYNTV